MYLKSLKNISINIQNLSIILILLSLFLYVIICFYSLTKPFIGFDDYYTLGILRFSFLDMIDATASNVHPPLYYIIFKFFKVLLGVKSNFGLVILGKIVSLIPLGLLLIASLTKVRKDFGILVSGIFCLLLCSSMQIMYFSAVIRMYSWGLFFITIQLIYAYDLIKNEGNYKSWIVFTIAAICASYTHYFAAISTILIYAYILLNNKQYKICFVSCVLSILAYLPWLNILFSQFLTVKENYWIKEITFKKLFDYFQFIFSPINNDVGTFIAVVLLLTIIILIYLIFVHGNISSRDKSYLALLLSLIFVTMMLGIVLSFLIRPIFVERYILPCFGGLWLGFAILIDKIKDKKKVFILVIILLLIVCVAGTIGFINETDSSFEDSNNNLNLLNSINENYDFIIMDDPLSYIRYSPYFNNSTVIYGDINESISLNPNQNTMIIFDKYKLLENNSDFNQIGEIHQDKIYLFEK